MMVAMLDIDKQPSSAVCISPRNRDNEKRYPIIRLWLQVNLQQPSPCTTCTCVRIYLYREMSALAQTHPCIHIHMSPECFCMCADTVHWQTVNIRLYLEKTKAQYYHKSLLILKNLCAASVYIIIHINTQSCGVPEVTTALYIALFQLFELHNEHYLHTMLETHKYNNYYGEIFLCVAYYSDL